MWLKYGLKAQKLLDQGVWGHDVLLMPGACGAYMRNLSFEPTLKSKACLKCLYFTKIISDLCRNLECFSYLYTINQTE